MQLLLVEDDPLVREVVAAALEELGYEVVVTSSGEEALERMRTAPRPPAVVTDIDLGPGCSGIELADRLLGSCPDLPVVFITGRPDRLCGRAPRRHEARLGKPFGMAQLAEAVCHVAHPGRADVRGR